MILSHFGSQTVFWHRTAMGLRKSYSYIENTQQVFEQNSQPTLTIEFKIRIRISNTHLLRLRVQHIPGSFRIHFGRRPTQQRILIGLSCNEPFRNPSSVRACNCGDVIVTGFTGIFVEFITPKRNYFRAFTKTRLVHNDCPIWFSALCGTNGIGISLLFHPRLRHILVTN